MSTIINPAEFIQKHWALTKHNLYPYWDKLPQNDIDTIIDYDTLINKLNEVYNLPPAEFNEKLNLFVLSLKSNFSSESLSKIKTLLHRYTYDTEQEWKDAQKK